LTTLLANGGSVDVNVALGDGDFGWGIGFNLCISQPGGAGTTTIAGYAIGWAVSEVRP